MQTSTPESRSPAVVGEAESAVDVLDRLAGGALAEVVDRADHDRPIGEAVGEDADLRPVGVLDAGELRRDALRQDRDDGARGVALLEQRPQVGARRADVARRDEPAPDRQQVRRERDGEAEQLRDLRHVLVRADPVRRDVLEHEAGVRATPSACGPRPSSRTCASTTTDSGSIASASGAEREQRRGRVAPRVRDQAPSGGDELGQAVDQSPSSSGRGCVKPYQASYAAASRSRWAPERSTTTPRERRLDRRRLLVRRGRGW